MCGCVLVFNACKCVLAMNLEPSVWHLFKKRLNPATMILSEGHADDVVCTSFC